MLLSSRLASASAATRRLRSLQLLLSFASVSAALLPDCVRFSYCSPIASTSTLLPNGVRFVCCFPIASASTLLRPLHLLLPDCIRFNCCSPIASASAAAPRQLFWKIPACPLLWVVKAASEWRPRASEQYLCFIMLWQHLYILPNETWLTDCTVIALSEKCGFALLWQRQGIT